MHTRYRQC